MKAIDIHTHGIGGYDTRTTDAGHILKIAEIQGSFGVSEILPTIYPSDIETMRTHMETVKMAMDLQRSAVNRHGAAIIAGLHLEGPFLNPSRCGSLRSRSFVKPAGYYLKQLIEGFEDMVRIITISPEVKGAVRLIRMIRDRGIAVSMGHSDATFAEAEAGFHAGAGCVTHIFNAMRGIHHREPGIAGFGLLNQDIYIEVIADPYHLHQKIIELIFLMKNKKKIILISDTVKETKSGKKESRGVRNASGRLLGGSTTVTESVRRLAGLGLEEGTIKQCISINPRMYLHMQ
jgi:N-acetylglucosamine-6-phosphate deacetylase